MAMQETIDFQDWLAGLKDLNARAQIVIRIERLKKGNPGDVGPVGEGISELRLHYGPGYRVYYKTSGDMTTILCGGTKASQKKDIKKAKKFGEYF